MEEKLQHIQLPNSLEDYGLTPKDKFVYIVIKSFDKGKGCFPSLEKIAKRAGTSVPTIRECTKRLLDSGVIEVIKRGRGKEYIFKKYLKFEPFSEDFFKADLSFGAKSYMAAIQQYLITDIEGIGKLSIPRRKISKQLLIPESSTRKYDMELQRRGVLQIVKNNSRDIETGCKTDTRIYNLRAIGQAIIWKLRDHEDRITENEVAIANLKEKLESQTKLINKLTEELSRHNESKYEYKV